MTERMPRGPRAARVAQAAPVFAALGDHVRLALVARLGTAGPLSIARLAEGATITRQAVTKHLQVLERAGVARSERRGRERIWACDADRLRDARRVLDDVSKRWDATLERLTEFVEP